MYEIITFPCKVELAPPLPCQCGALAPSLFARATQTFFSPTSVLLPPWNLSPSVRQFVRRGKDPIRPHNKTQETRENGGRQGLWWGIKK